MDLRGMDLHGIASVLTGQPVGTLLKVRPSLTDGKADGGLVAILTTGQKYVFAREAVEKATTVEQEIYRAPTGQFVATVSADKDGKPEVVKRPRGKKRG